MNDTTIMVYTTNVTLTIEPQDVEKFKRALNIAVAKDVPEIYFKTQAGASMMLNRDQIVLIGEYPRNA